MSGEKYHEDCLSFCCFCRFTIMGSFGYYGKQLKNTITGVTHTYCFGCYPKAVDVLLADLRLKDYLVAKNDNLGPLPK